MSSTEPNLEEFEAKYGEFITFFNSQNVDAIRQDTTNLLTLQLINTTVEGRHINKFYSKDNISIDVKLYTDIEHICFIINYAFDAYNYVIFKINYNDYMIRFYIRDHPSDIFKGTGLSIDYSILVNDWRSSFYIQHIDIMDHRYTKYFEMAIDAMTYIMSLAIPDTKDIIEDESLESKFEDMDITQLSD
jgi:hypothetical protein